MPSCAMASSPFWSQRCPASSTARICQAYEEDDFAATLQVSSISFLPACLYEPPQAERVHCLHRRSQAKQTY